jgi:membrane protease YdiL (CAAX protease family)
VSSPNALGKDCAPRRLPAAEGAVLLFALLFPSGMTWLYFVALSNQGGGTNPAALAAYTLGKVVQFSLPALYVFLLLREPLCWSWPGSAGLAAGLLFGLLVSGGAGLLYALWLQHTSWRAELAPRLWAKLQEAGCTTPRRYLLLIGFLAGIHSLAEEYYWRWFVFGRWRRYLPVLPAVLLSSLGFMAHHLLVLAVYLPQHFWSAALPLALAVAAGGAYWAWLYERSHSLWAIWLSHALVDLGILAIGFHLAAPYWAPPLGP